MPFLSLFDFQPRVTPPDNAPRIDIPALPPYQPQPQPQVPPPVIQLPEPPWFIPPGPPPAIRLPEMPGWNIWPQRPVPRDRPFIPDPPPIERPDPPPIPVRPPRLLRNFDRITNIGCRKHQEFIITQIMEQTGTPQFPSDSGISDIYNEAVKLLDSCPSIRDPFVNFRDTLRNYMIALEVLRKLSKEVGHPDACNGLNTADNVRRWYEILDSYKDARMAMQEAYDQLKKALLACSGARFIVQ